MAYSCPHTCPACPQGKRPAMGIGPYSAEVVLIGEAPGRMENNIGKPFVGKTGEELDRVYLPLAGLYRGGVFLTNTVKCYVADSGKAPTTEQVAHCAGIHIRAELKRIHPKVVVLMGGTACSLVPGIDLEVDHGISRKARLFDWEGTVFPTYHPALGIHQGSAMRQLLADFEALRGVVRGGSTWPRRKWNKQEYQRCTTEEQVNRSLYRAVEARVAVGVDTESKWTPTGYEPWSVQWSYAPGYSYMARRSDIFAWDTALDLLSRARVLVLHNAPADMRTFERAGRPMPWRIVRDTMQMAYRLGLPQGLKPLGFRLMGIRMRSFEEVTKPYARERVLDYLIHAAERDWGQPAPVPLGEWKTQKCKGCGGKGVRPVFKGARIKAQCGVCGGAGEARVEKVYQAQGLNPKVNRLITDLVSKDGVDPWDRWEGWTDDGQTQECEKALGPLPRPCISLVPDEEAEEYAIQDADVTIQVYEELRRRAIELRRSVR